MPRREPQSGDPAKSPSPPQSQSGDSAGPKPRRPRGVNVDGMLLLDKPPAMTSNQALQIAKRLMNARKAGHTGSLDPIATGLLPLCFGETTRVAELFLGAGKTYWVRIRFGLDTDTGDREGKALREAPVAFTEQQLLDALRQFRGRIKQIPPMFSALKRGGRPLYKLARKGISVEREAREVTVHDLAVEKWRGDLLDLTLSCSRGFYLRALARDLGRALGCGAHVSELRRTAVGDFSVQDAVSVAQLEEIEAPAARRRLLLPTWRAVAHLPEVSVPDNIAALLCRGRPVRVQSAAQDGLVRVSSPGGGFLGLADLAGGKITPRRLFHRPRPPRR